MPTKGVDNFYRLLENKADRVVTLLVNVERRPARRARGEGAADQEARRTSAISTGCSRAARTSTRPRAAASATSTCRTPAAEGNRELFKYFYPQVDKDALIIDDRYNGGGFIPDRMIELLDRPVLNYWVAPRPRAGDRRRRTRTTGRR